MSNSAAETAAAAAALSPSSPSTSSANVQLVQDKEVQQDEAGAKTPVVRRTNEEMLASGGCSVAQVIYENGQEWHPMLPTGEQKCVKCRCKVSARTRFKNIYQNFALKITNP